MHNTHKQGVLLLSFYHISVQHRLFSSPIAL